MRYIKIDKDTFIQFNEETKQSSTINKPELESQIADLEGRLKDAISPTDNELLEWARLNFPFVDHSAEQIELDRLNNIFKELT